MYLSKNVCVLRNPSKHNVWKTRCSNHLKESFTLGLLEKFKSKLHAIKEKVQTEGDKVESKDEEDINTDEWLGHTLRFEDKGAVLAKDASTKGDDWFDIYDPRNPINKRKREKNEKNKK